MVFGKFINDSWTKSVMQAHFFLSPYQVFTEKTDFTSSKTSGPLDYTYIGKYIFPFRTWDEQKQKIIDNLFSYNLDNGRIAREQRSKKDITKYKQEELVDIDGKEYIMFKDIPFFYRQHAYGLYPIKLSFTTEKSTYDKLGLELDKSHSPKETINPHRRITQ